MAYYRNTLKHILAVIWIAALLAGCSAPAAAPATATAILPRQEADKSPAQSAAEAAPPDAPVPAIPEGWILHTDTGGTCQAAVPAAWQLGHDFFLAGQNTEPGPFASAERRFPPVGLALWGSGDTDPLPQGKWFQMRIALVSGEQVCSLWRIKQDADFTAAERSEMEQVGKTLQEVH